MKFPRLLAGILACIAMLFAFAPSASAAPPDRSEVPLTGIDADGETVDVGTLDLTSVAPDGDGDLLISGEVTSAINGATQDLTDVAVTATEGESRCDVLFLDLAGLDLDVLGLNVVLEQVILDVFAEPGPGNLLGNLLCSVTGLLDSGGPLDGVTGLLDGLLDRITGLLG